MASPCGPCSRTARSPGAHLGLIPHGRHLLLPSHWTPEIRQQIHFLEERAEDGTRREPQREINTVFLKAFSWPVENLSPQIPTPDRTSFGLLPSSESASPIPKTNPWPQAPPPRPVKRSLPRAIFAGRERWGRYWPTRALGAGPRCKTGKRRRSLGSARAFGKCSF